jgi:hypothetical protein
VDKTLFCSFSVFKVANFNKVNENYQQVGASLVPHRLAGKKLNFGRFPMSLSFETAFLSIAENY